MLKPDDFDSKPSEIAKQSINNLHIWIISILKKILHKQNMSVMEIYL